MNNNNVLQQGQLDLPKSRVLVTGGAGFIGSHLTFWLLSQGYHVTILDDLSGGFERNTHMEGDVVRVKASVTCADDVEETFKQGKFDYVFHLAAYAAEGLSHFIRNFNYTNNLIGTTNIVNACVNYKVKHLTFTSSIAVYGDEYDGKWATENSPCHPIDPYGVAKLACEHDIISAGHYFGLNYTIFRLHNVYGTRQNIGDPYRNVIGIFMNQLLKGQPMTIIGDGQQHRSFTYVHSIVPTMAKAPITPEVWGEVYNLGSDVAYTIKHVSQLVAAAMKRPPNVIHVDDRQESRGIMIDHSKIRAMARVFDTPLARGLEQMAEWVLTHGPQQGQPFGPMEIREDLPTFWRHIVNQET
jgi:UDP-glucose 4-epimerase